MAKERHSTSFPISKGCSVKLKKGQPVKLNVELTIWLEPSGGALRVRCAATETPAIVPKRGLHHPTAPA